MLRVEWSGGEAGSLGQVRVHPLSLPSQSLPPLPRKLVHIHSELCRPVLLHYNPFHSS